MHDDGNEARTFDSLPSSGLYFRARWRPDGCRRRLRHCRLRKVALQVLRRLRHERLWRVFRESRASHALGPACDSAGQTTAPPASMEVDSSANRAEPAAKATLSPLAAEFSPGLSVAEVTAAWSGAAAAWDKRPTTNPSGLAESGVFGRGVLGPGLRLHVRHPATSTGLHRPTSPR